MNFVFLKLSVALPEAEIFIVEVGTHFRNIREGKT